MRGKQKDGIAFKGSSEDEQIGIKKINKKWGEIKTL